MVGLFSVEDRVLIKVLWHEKEYGAKNWSQNFVKSLDIVGLEERYVWLLYFDSHISVTLLK